MVKYFILIKRIGTNKWLGAIPARAGASKAQLQIMMRKQIKKGFTYKIVTEVTFKRLLSKSRRKKTVSRRRKVRRSRRRTSRRLGSRRRRTRKRRSYSFGW